MLRLAGRRSNAFFYKKTTKIETPNAFPPQTNEPGTHTKRNQVQDWTQKGRHRRQHVLRECRKTLVKGAQIAQELQELYK